MFRTESDPGLCRQLWDRFSPGKGAWDDWDLMYAFHDADRHRMNFLVHETSAGEPDGLVPLVYDSTQDRHMPIGGSYPDGRVLWIRHEDFAELFDQLPERTVFFDLAQGWVAALLEVHPQFKDHFAETDQRYYLVPAEFEFDFHNHIDRFAREKRQKFLYDLRNIHKREPKIEWSTANEAELFIDLVNRNFGDQSDYANDKDADEVRRVVGELSRSGRLRTLKVSVDGTPQAVSLSLLHANRMVALYSASNNDYNNLGKLTNVETIQEACRLRVDEISFMTGMQWKASWQMTSEPCHTFRKPPGPWAEAQG